MPDFRSSPSVSRNPTRTLISIMIVSLMAISSAFARKAWHHHSNRAASSNLAPAKALGPCPNVIRTTSRSIGRSEAFAGGVDRLTRSRPVQTCAIGNRALIERGQGLGDLLVVSASSVEKPSLGHQRRLFRQGPTLAIGLAGPAASAAMSGTGGLYRCEVGVGFPEEQPFRWAA
jgi:hypothetical protein